MVKKAPVQTPESEEVVTATLDGGNVAQATIPEGVTDEAQQTLQSQLDEMKSQYDEMTKKYERDIGGVKSSLQKRERELAQTWQDKEATYKKQVDDLRKMSMSEADRKNYEYELALERTEEMSKAIKEAEATAEETKNFYAWKDRFVNEWKVPSDQLVLDQGVEALVQSGMAVVDMKMKEAQMKSVEQTKPVTPVVQAKTSKEPPETAKPVSGGTVNGITPTEAVKKYAGGDWEKFFQMLDQGRLDRGMFTEMADFYDKEKP
jgi:Skp family chaperone for outer membrane proteins